MARAKCPDPALLQAYVDGTLFSRDVPAIEEHVATCEKCAALLATIRQEHGRASASTWSRPHIIGAAAAAIVVGGIAAWAVWPGGNDVAPSETTVATQPEPPVTAPQAAASAPVESPAPPPPPASTPAPAPETAPPPRERPAKAERRAQPTVKEGPPPAEASPATDVAQADGGVIVRGGRRSNRRVMWRARDLVIEYSTDGGKTWASEYTTDRIVRAGAFVSPDAAWLVGDSGLVLRRTKNGWFGATPPADGNIRGIRASSTSKATVTLEDGRVFTTDNGGVAWSLVRK